MGATILEAHNKRRAVQGQESAMISESHLICCCLIDEGATLDRALSAGLSGADFSDTKLATTFEELRTLRQKNKPITVTGLVEQLGPRLKMFGSIETVMALSDSAQVGHTTTHAGHHLKEVIKASISRRLASGAEIGEIQHLLDAVIGTKAAPRTLRLPSHFKPLADTDTSNLLGNRYLNRGDGLVISGQSGCGKSSMQTQMAVRWALGEDFMGIRPSAPLKSLIIQSEDSDGDIGEVLASLHHVLQHTEEQRTQIDRNIRIDTDRIHRGKAFIQSLRRHIDAFQPDLVWINPLQAFVDGDITASRDIGAFLREGLNGINDAKFGYILIHHTTKPATGKDRHDRLWHEQMYDMAGGAEIINWARAIISIKPLGNPGEYSLRLAKRGRRAGVVKQVEAGVGFRSEPITELGLKHATGNIDGHPIIFWEGIQLPEPTSKTHEGVGGRQPKYLFNDYRTLFPVKTGPGLNVNELHRALMPNGEIKRNILHQVCKRWSDDGEVEIIDIHGQPRRYRATV